MAALIWGAWGEQWALAEKVSLDGTAKTITVHSDVTALDIRGDVYSAWVRWTEREPWATQAMRFSGADVIPGGETGLTFFLINGWKLIYDPNAVAMSGVLYSEDYATPYWSAIGAPIYPATVSALVNSAVSYQNVVTGTALTPSETADAVWTAAARSLTSSLDPSASQIAAEVWSHTTGAAMADRLAVAAAILRNRTITDPTTGIMTVYADDGITPLFAAQLYENAAGTQAYRGQGSERRERLT